MTNGQTSDSPSPEQHDQPEDERPDLGLTLNLLPDEIKLRKEQLVRKFKGSPEAEEKSIRELALSLLEPEGQLLPLIVREEKQGQYSLIAGHRRRAAAMRINSGEFKSRYDPKKQGPFTLECVVRRYDDAQAKRAAIIENIQRKNFTPIDLMLLIADARKENGWEGGENTKQVAAYFGVSTATITEHEKLAEAPKSIQQQVHSGEMTTQAALTAIKRVEPEKREEVVEDAKKLSREEAKEAVKRADANPKMSAKQKAIAKKNAEKPKVQEKHVVQAARKKGALKGKEPRQKKELIGFFESMCGPASPPVMASFAAYFVKFSQGEGTEGTLLRKWDEIAEALPKSKGEPKPKRAA